MTQRLATERSRLVAAEAKKARNAAVELQARTDEATEFRRVLDANNITLAEAQQAQAEVMRRQRALDEEKRELDLTVEKRVQASVDQIQLKAKQEAGEAAQRQVAVKDQTIGSMSRTIEELKRKAEQGSQQSQGDVLELELEGLLRGRLPTDLVEQVEKVSLALTWFSKSMDRLDSWRALFSGNRSVPKLGATDGSASFPGTLDLSFNIIRSS